MCCGCRSFSEYPDRFVLHRCQRGKATQATSTTDQYLRGRPPVLRIPCGRRTSARSEFDGVIDLCVRRLAQTLASIEAVKGCCRLTHSRLRYGKVTYFASSEFAYTSQKAAGGQYRGLLECLLTYACQGSGLGLRIATPLLRG